MTNPKRKVEVSLQGQRFQLRSDKPEDYLHGLATFVSEQLEEIRNNAKSASGHNMALLLSLNLADKLFEKEEELHRLKTSLESRTQEALQEVQAALSMLPDSVPLEVRDDEVS
ncbi:MAG: cell division protein ZapA [Myxococcaceae bacterium]